MEEVISGSREDIYKQFEEFFSTVKKDELAELASTFPEPQSLEVDFNELDNFNSDFADSILNNPDKYITIAEDAMASLNTHALIVPKEQYKPKLRIYNLPDIYNVSVQNLGAGNLDKLVKVEGAVSWITDIYPRIQNAVWECVHCWQITTTKPQKIDAVKPPLQCKCGRNHFKLLEEKSTFINMQRSRMQEMVEKLKGSMPSSHVDLWFENDLVNQVSPGEKLMVTGILRLKPNKEGKSKSTVYSKYLDVLHIAKVQQEFESIEISKEEEKQIKEIANSHDVFEKIVKSVAPSIYGYNELKQAVALQLFGGTPGKKLPDGHTIRNDVHILLCGDPGTGKSAILQYVVRLAPKGIFTSGKGSSAVGMCVAGDSIVELNDAGLYEIGQLIESKFDAGVEEEPGAFSKDSKLCVASLELDGLKTGFADATKIWKIKSPSELVSITTRRGKQLTLTPATPVLVFENGEVKWKKSGELTGAEWIASSRAHSPLKGKQTPLLPLVSTAAVHVANPITDFFIKVTDKLAKANGSLQNVAVKYGISRDLMYAYRLKGHRIPLNLLLAICRDAKIVNSEVYPLVTKLETQDRSFVSIPTFVTPEIAYIAGVLAGDGDISSGKSGGIRFTSNSPEHIQLVTELIAKVFEVNPKVSKQKGKTPQVRVSSIVLRDIFTKLGVPAGEKSHAIDLPPLLTQSGAENVAAFIRGWMDTDGYVAITKRGSSSIGLSTASEKAARKLLILFEWFGIKAKLRIRDKRGYVTEIRGKKVITKLLQYQIEIRGKENFKAYASAIGFWKREKQTKLQQLLSQETKLHSNNDGVPVSSWLQTLFARYKVPQTVITSAHKRKINPVLPSRVYLTKMAEYFEKINAPEAKALKTMAETDVQWETITKLTRVAQKSDWVYDFTITGSHAFLANGILVHNTASAEKDELTGGWILKAGAMVLGSGGIVMIDEFDKMDAEDRGALHESMEQQKISIAKAGILTTFQTKAAVLAAANPKYGRFDPNAPTSGQFDIPPTLLSRFDLIFAIKDVLDEAHDRKLAEHIVTGHTYGNAKQTPVGDSAIMPLIESDLLRKYIAYARRNVFPVLTTEASEKIKDFYLELRRLGKKSNTFPITARQIEGVIRLSEASAKVRLSPRVELQDAERAIGLVTFVLHDVFMDKETGAIDSDIISIGQPKSKVDKLRTLMNVISSLEKQFDMVDMEEIIKECSQVNIDEHAVRKMIDDLKRNGDLYEPKPGYVKTARRKGEW